MGKKKVAFFDYVNLYKNNKPLFFKELKDAYVSTGHRIMASCDLLNINYNNFKAWYRKKKDVKDFIRNEKLIHQNNLSASKEYKNVSLERKTEYELGVKNLDNKEIEEVLNKTDDYKSFEELNKKKIKFNDRFVKYFLKKERQEQICNKLFELVNEGDIKAIQIIVNAMKSKEASIFIKQSIQQNNLYKNKNNYEEGTAVIIEKAAPIPVKTAEEIMEKDKKIIDVEAQPEPTEDPESVIIDQE